MRSKLCFSIAILTLGVALLPLRGFAASVPITFAATQAPEHFSYSRQVAAPRRPSPGPGTASVASPGTLVATGDWPSGPLSF